LNLSGALTKMLDAAFQYLSNDNRIDIFFHAGPGIKSGGGFFIGLYASGLI